MNATGPTLVPSEKLYKTWLLKARSLTGRSMRTAWERATLLCRVFDDREFRADHGSYDDVRLAEMLDGSIGDLCLTFLELRAVLKQFPERKQWESSDLRKMYREVQKTRSAATPRPLVPQPIANPLPAVTPEALSRAVARQEQAVADKEEQVEETGRLRAKIAKLENENIRLRRRVAELEDQLRTVRECEGAVLVG